MLKLRIIFINKIIYQFIFLFSVLLACDGSGSDNVCSEYETYLNCIDDCPIPEDVSLFWIEDIALHIDSSSVSIPIQSINLENIEGIQFTIEYDDMLELSSCSVDNQSSCFINQISPGIAKVVAYVASANSFNINNQIMSLQFIIDDSALIGEVLNISFSEFIVNYTDVLNHVSNGIVTIGNFGCMDSQACNYSSNATFDDDSCAYEFDCNSECGGGAIEDCLGVCQGDALIDCNGECGGDAVIDECGNCDGSGVPQGSCDCEGTAPFIYCVDGDGDGLGNPNYTFEFCDLIENDEFPELVLNCNDVDDECISDEFDSCGVCGGPGPDSNNCCPNTGTSILGDIPDDCGICSGDMFKGENGFYPDGSCDCQGTPPINYCIDIDGDGDSDSDPFSSCSEPALGDIFISCETLNIKNIKVNQYNLFSIYPNPFNPSTTIDYKIDKLSFVEMNILDLNGRYLKTLVDEVKMPGKYSVVWTPDRTLSSGVYLLEMQFNDQILIEKINFIK